MPPRPPTTLTFNWCVFWPTSGNETGHLGDQYPATTNVTFNHCIFVRPPANPGQTGPDVLCMKPTTSKALNNLTFNDCVFGALNPSTGLRGSGGYADIEIQGLTSGVATSTAQVFHDIHFAGCIFEPGAERQLDFSGSNEGWSSSLPYVDGYNCTVTDCLFKGSAATSPPTATR